MLRKIIISLMLFLLMFSMVGSAQGIQDMNLLDKIVAVEKIIYGVEQTGSLLERVSKIEKDLYGLETKDALMVKVDKLYAYTRDNLPFSPSFITKINAVEWALTRHVTIQPAKARIENLEQILLGHTLTGSFDDRLNKLLKLAFANGQIDILHTNINKDTLVKISITTPLSTKTSHVGDLVAFQVADDIYNNGQLVVAKGASGLGKVIKVSQAKNFGRDAQLEISFDSIEAIDGSVIKTVLGDKAKEETKSLAKAAGATVAGLAILGPIGVVGGAFVHGQDVNIPADSQMFIQTKNDSEVYGLQLRDNK